MAITTAAEYAKLGTVQEPIVPDYSTVKLAYIDMVINMSKTQLMLVTQHPLF